VATVVDPILTSFRNRIKAVRTSAAAKLPVLRDVAGLANFTGMQLSECVRQLHDAGRLQYRPLHHLGAHIAFDTPLIIGRELIISFWANCPLYFPPET